MSCNQILKRKTSSTSICGNSIFRLAEIPNLGLFSDISAITDRLLDSFSVSGHFLLSMRMAKARFFVSFSVRMVPVAPLNVLSPGIPNINDKIKMHNKMNPMLTSMT